MGREEYADQTQRNIGLLTEDQQNVLKDATVAVLGAGGLGGVIIEILARTGIEKLKTADFDKFDRTNFNRQIFAFEDTIGQWKIDVTEEYLKKINSDITIEKYKEPTQENISQILEGVDVVVLALDSVKPCILIAREAQKLGIPVVEGWALPFGNVRVFTKDTPSLEEVYNFPTQGKDLASIPEEQYKELKLYMLEQLKKIEGIEQYYPELAIQRIMAGKIPSFAPMVWLTAVLMSMEALKILLDWGKIALSPEFAVYDPFQHNIPRQKTAEIS